MVKTVSKRQVLLSLCLVTATFLAGHPISGSSAQTIFFTENFDNTNFASRGWYDLTTGTIDTSVYSPAGGTSSLNIHWAAGAAAPAAPRRHLFTASDTVYLSYWMKLGAANVTWVGSGLPYHPHVIQLLTNADDDWVGPSVSFLSARLDLNVFIPRFNAGDASRINTARLGVNLMGTATAHAVMGGNGNQTATSTYFLEDGIYSNTSDWKPSPEINYFKNNTWHHVEFYIAMNSVSGGVPQANGVVKWWVDGQLVINSSNVYLRTAQYASQKFNKFLLVPYIGPPGSPKAQDMWIDNLIVADQPPASPTSVPSPTNLRVQ